VHATQGGHCGPLSNHREYHYEPRHDPYHDPCRDHHLLTFDSLAAYEAYRAHLRTDAEARRNFALALERRFILREERNFVEVVDGTYNMAAEKA